MSLFKIRQKKGEDYSVHVGFLTSKELYSLFSLYCLYFQIPRSNVLRELVENWIDSKSNEYSNAVKRLADEAVEAWNSNKYNSVDEFCDEVREMLERKGLESKEINEVVKQIKENIENK